MKFTLAIYGAPSNTQAAHSALQFARALITQGHTLYRLFFYADGVYNASTLITPPQDEINLPLQWQQFIHEHQLDAVVCIAAALRRGILDKTEAARYQKSASNLNDCFELSGLGQLIEAAIASDRVVAFGN